MLNKSILKILKEFLSIICCKKYLCTQTWILLVLNSIQSGFLKVNDVICSNHFMNGCKSNELLNPNYVPTIFPDIYKKRTIQSKYNKRWVWKMKIKYK